MGCLANQNVCTQTSFCLDENMLSCGNIHPSLKSYSINRVAICTRRDVICTNRDAIYKNHNAVLRIIITPDLSVSASMNKFVLINHKIYHYATVLHSGNT